MSWRWVDVLGLRLGGRNDLPYKVLCLGAHADDIEIGCGGTILRLIRDYRDIVFYWIVFNGNPERREEALTSAHLFLKDVEKKVIETKNFRDGFFPFQGTEIKEYFERIKSAFSPDLIFTHYREDRHQDHRLISDLTWNTFRDHLILEYEIPKYDGDLGVPNAFVPLEEAVCRRKVAYIRDSFKTQRGKHWFAEDVFFALLRLRGIESGVRYAEAFHSRKIILE